MATLAAYEVEWNGEELPITTTVDRLAAGTYPDTLRVFHPRYGTIRLGRPGMYGADYVVSRSGAPLPGLGVSRTFANMPLDEEQLFAYLHEVFRDLKEHLNVRNIARQKLLRLQMEGVKKQVNEYEKKTGQTMPKELRNRMAQMLGEKKPVSGSNTVYENFARIQGNLFGPIEQNNLQRINTSLFQGGRKRKTLRKRRGRKSTRKH